MHGLNHEKLLHAAVGVNVEVPETPVRKPAVPQLEGEGGGGEGEGGVGVVQETYKKGAPAVAGKLAHPPQPPPLKRTTEAPTHPLGQALGGWVPVKVSEVVTEFDKVPPLQVKEYCIIQPPG